MEEKDKKLSILYLITKSNFGGAQRYVFDLATNHEVPFINTVQSGTIASNCLHTTIVFRQKLG
jgi:hypothetical protein